VDLSMQWVWVVASTNDPDASLLWRVDGQDWLNLVSGVNTKVVAVPSRGWLLIEVKVVSPWAGASAFQPLIYQVVVTREIVCNERCLSCFGPSQDNCTSCRAPLVLYNGKCEATDCPPDGYYEWQSFQCRPCSASCAQCNGAGEDACTLCPALTFLSAETWEDLTGSCVSTCPPGSFAHPSSRRCKNPPTAAVKTFYISFVFRVTFTEFQKDTRLQESVLNTTSFVLGVSLSDVRAYSLEQGNNGVMKITVEVVSPFLSQADADKIIIDTWFGAFEVPVDVIRTHTWDEMHPPLPQLPSKPYLPYWVWGFIISGATSAVVLLPFLYYFRRLNNTRKRYHTRVTVDAFFLDRVVNQSPAWLIRWIVAQETGAKQFKMKGPRN